MTIRGVIFDMGGTLLYYTPPGKDWEDMEKIGAGGVYNYLRHHNYSLPPESEALDTAWEFIRSRWITLLDTHDVTQLKLHPLLQMLTNQQWGVDALAPHVVNDLAQAYMTAIQAQVRPLDGVIDMLQTMRDQNLRLGLISNTVWPGSAHEDDLKRFGLIGFLEHLIFSADAEAWKPFREVFQLSLDALNLEPDEAIYVGDSLYFDVWGAQQAGLRGVWIEQNHPWLPDGAEVTPDATIKHLSELPEVVDGWR